MMRRHSRGMRSVMIRGLLLLLALVGTCHADIYAFVDSNGVRHISNSPDDPRYKLVMSTPTYQNRENTNEETFASTHVAVSRSSSGWKFYSPANGSTSYITWGTDGSGVITSTGKPFQINAERRQRYHDTIVRLARRHRLDPNLVHAVISAESAYNYRAVSHAGAQGLMQLMPATAERFGVTDPFDPEQNMNAGMRYLRWLLDRFKSVNLALAGYNAGEGAVERYNRQIPPFEETQTYVRRVLQFYNHYRSGGT